MIIKKYFCYVLTIIFIQSFFNAINIFALEYQLFENNKPGVFSKDYNFYLKQIKKHFVTQKLKEPITIVFSNGDKKIIDGFLGSGTQSFVLSSGNEAIRIPIKNELQYQKELNNYHNAWTEMAKSTNKDKFLLKLYKHIDNEYTVVEKLNIKFDYQKYLDLNNDCLAIDNNFDESDYDKEFFKEGECSYCKLLEQNKKLIELAKSLSEFTVISDLIAQNLVYVENPIGTFRWILADFGLPVTFYDPLKDKINSFSVFSKIKIPIKGLLALETNIKQAVEEERKSKHQLDKQECTKNVISTIHNTIFDVMKLIESICEVEKKYSK
ncbi:MAG: hypothetical protein HQK49_04735 [Oligoflexia bacterium]|nr:hypothetical protein [Oligoflexia bacterium]